MQNAVAPPETLPPLESIDLYDPERYRSGSQHAAWHALRTSAPVWRQCRPDGSAFWSVSRYRDVLEVIKDHRNFSSEYGTILAVLDGDSAGGRTINLMDPPRHRGIRVPTMRLLTAAAVARAEERVRLRVRNCLGDLATGAEMDVVPSILGLPMFVVGDILGVPEEYWSAVANWSMAGVAPEDPHYAAGSVSETLRSVHCDLLALFSDLVDSKRKHPADDLMSTLIGIRMDGRELSTQEVLLNCYSFIMGANTTTPHVVLHLLLALSGRPAQWTDIRGRRVSIATTVEEALRWATPTNHLMRRTRTSVEVAGTSIGPGELVCAWVGSANRDSSIFQDPYEFDASRKPNRHIAFGGGPHYCNGAPAARLITRLFLEEMVHKVHEIEVTGPVSHLYSNFINGITSMAMRLYPIQHRA